MKISEVEEKKYNKIDKITKTVTTIICVVLSSIFIGACVYMLNLINESQNETSNNNTETPQNMNLVNM